MGVALAWPGEGLSPTLRAGLGPAQVHLLTVGWLTQLVFGVALWMFPRPRGRRQIRDLGLDRAAWAGLNLGVALRLFAEPAALVGSAAGLAGTVLLSSALLQWLAVIHFAVRLWPRVTSR